MLVLVIEDEVDLATTLEYNLRAEGFTVRVAHSGRQGLASATADPLPDVIVLDLMLPDLSGTEICRKLREGDRTRDIPVVMCTAKGEEIDRVVGFEVGADDYVVKPFSIAELVGRVRALLRRRRLDRSGAAGVVSAGDLRIDLVRQEVTVGSRRVALTPAEVRLATLLVREPERAFTREELMATIWNTESTASSRACDTHVLNLRRKLGRSTARIETVRGVGYRLRVA
jgi:two-component system, OmpR family, phosphate regulon response regulator PhoB